MIQCKRVFAQVEKLTGAIYDKVNKFYEFWWNFKSWREFSGEDEHDLDQAESRDERRWMERQNEKKRGSLKIDERARILKLAGMFDGW